MESTLRTESQAILDGVEAEIVQIEGRLAALEEAKQQLISRIQTLDELEQVVAPEEPAPEEPAPTT